MKTKVNAIICKKCKDTVFSRALHDFRTCSCGSVGIGGGFWKARIDGKVNEYIEIGLFIEQTPMELYKDWAERKHKYGIIKEKKK